MLAGSTGVWTGKQPVHWVDPSKLFSRWLLSQNGFVEEPPHRQSAIDLPASGSTCVPSASRITTSAASSAAITNGPFRFSRIVMVTGKGSESKDHETGTEGGRRGDGVDSDPDSDPRPRVRIGSHDHNEKGRQLGLLTASQLTV